MRFSEVFGLTAVHWVCFLRKPRDFVAGVVQMVFATYSNGLFRLGS